MSDRTDVLTLLGEIRKSRDVLARINRFYDSRFATETGGTGERTTERGIILAEVLGNYYTCLETIFLRVAQFFENSLSDRSWHKQLLQRMTMEVPRIRPRVISDQTYGDLEELLRFRHFRRYYMEFEYDWERLAFVEARYRRARPEVERALDTFEAHLSTLTEKL